MASPIPKPPGQLLGRTKPRRGDWQASPGIGWQHGKLPPAPEGLMPPSKVAWDTWLRSWFASNWVPANIPQLRKVIQLHDQVERGEFRFASELRYWMDGMGVTPKGQQDRRWLPPNDAARPTTTTAAEDPYGHLRVIRHDTA
ncbi:hypothetical protein BH23CHL8_BH23CHL8_31010 [soil metagenome]